MSQRALDAPARPLALPGAARGPRPDEVATIAPARALRRARRRWLWAAAAVALVAVSAALVVWARTLPSFDAYGWLTWGERTWHGGLDTNAAPSWKPLPYVFTVIYAVLGHHLELRLWMVTSAAVALAGVVFAGRVAYRLTAPRPGRAWAGWVAAVFTGVALLGLRDELHYGYLHYVFSSQSDPMIVAFVLAAIDLALSRRPRLAFGCGLLACLGRPEAWPFLALYSLWLWRSEPAARWLIAGGWLALAALWFGIPALSSRTPFVAAANALDSGRAPSGDRVTAVLSRFGELQHWPVYVAAGLCVAVAALRCAAHRGAALPGSALPDSAQRDSAPRGSAQRDSAQRDSAPRGSALRGSALPDSAQRDSAQPGSALRRSALRDRAALALAGGIVVWVAIEIAFGLHGWPALGRYMFEPAAVATVLAGAFAGRALGADWSAIASAPLQEVWRFLPEGSTKIAKLLRGVRSSPGGPTVAGVVVVAALVGAMVPAAVSAVAAERSDLTQQHARTAEIEALPAVIKQLGGARLLRGCGEPLTRLQYQSVLAYALSDNVSQVGFKYSEALAHGNPVLFITPYESGVGWQVQAAHQTAPACAALPTTPTNIEP